MILVAINCNKQIGNKFSKDLYHQSVFAFCNKMIQLQVTFLPCKKLFDIPSERINISDLLSCQVLDIRSIECPRLCPPSLMLSQV